MRYSERFDHEVGQVAQFFVIEVLMFDSLIPHSRILPRPVTTRRSFLLIHHQTSVPVLFGFVSVRAFLFWFLFICPFDFICI